MDPDGDMTAVYSGFGPDTTTDLKLTAAQNTYLQSLLSAYAAETDSGLNANQIAWLTSGKITLPYIDPNGVTNHTNPGDIDSEINEILLNAASTAKNGYGFNSIQLGRLRGILEQLANLARRWQRRYVFAMGRRPSA